MIARWSVRRPPARMARRPDPTPPDEGPSAHLLAVLAERAARRGPPLGLGVPPGRPGRAGWLRGGPPSAGRGPGQPRARPRPSTAGAAGPGRVPPWRPQLLRPLLHPAPERGRPA